MTAVDAPRTTADVVDLAVVGGGPVGLAAAVAGRLAGLSVAVVEPRAGDVDKACGEGLMPGALAALAGWGIEPHGARIAGFRYADGRRSVEHRFAGPSGRGVRRTVLHAALAGRARELGIPVRAASIRVLEPGRDLVGLPDAGLTAHHVIAADGLHSPLRRLAGLDAPARPDGRRFGLRRHFAVAPWTDLVEVHWRRDVELYVTPVDDDLIGVAVLGPRGTSFADAIAACAPVAERLAGAEPADALRGAGPLRQRVRSRTAGRLALVGDAAGYVDALTGEGLAVGFAAAREAVAAIVAGDLARYDRRWRSVTRVPRLITEGVLALATSPLRPAVVPIAAATPRLFGLAVEALARPR